MPHLLSLGLSRCILLFHPTAAAAGTAPLTWPPWPHTADTMTGSTLPSDRPQHSHSQRVKIISHTNKRPVTNIKPDNCSHITEKTPKLNKVPFIYMHYPKICISTWCKKKEIAICIIKVILWPERGWGVGFFLKLKQGVKCFTFQHVMCRSP